MNASCQLQWRSQQAVSGLIDEIGVKIRCGVMMDNVLKANAKKKTLFLFALVLSAVYIVDCKKMDSMSSRPPSGQKMKLK